MTRTSLPPMPETDDIAAVADLLRRSARATIAVHENPDLDAVGAAVGLVEIVRQCGGGATLRVRPGTVLPPADWFLDAGDVAEGPPPPGDVLYVVDSGSMERTALDLDGWTGTIVNIDHHPDNRSFGDLDLVRPQASSAAEIVYQLAVTLDITPSVRTATALYTGILFDTGHFRHPSTRAGTLRAAAALVEAGADPTAIYSAVFEDRSLADLRLWGRAVLSAVPVAGGRALVAVLTADDIAACDGSDRTSGIVEILRGARGVEVAALVRAEIGRPGTRVSLRSTGFDVSALARSRGGGGHRQAAGFSSDMAPEEVAAWLSSELDACLSTASC